MTVLPVSLLSFSATLKNAGNSETILNWATASEENSSYFTVEKSTREGNFIPIARVAARGNAAAGNSYLWIDKDATQPVCFYRLKMVDIDGRFSYSRTLSINKQLQTKISLYPNPVHNEAHLNIPSQGEEVLLLTITDQSGRMTERRLVQLKDGNNAVTINTAAMPKGVYLISINGNNRSEQVQMLKQ